MGGHCNIDGVEISYNIAYNVSYNRANPNRMTATCACGVQFMQLSCSDRVARKASEWLRDQFAWHRKSGYCRLAQ